VYWRRNDAGRSAHLCDESGRQYGIGDRLRDQRGDGDRRGGHGTVRRGDLARWHARLRDQQRKQQRVGHRHGGQHGDGDDRRRHTPLRNRDQAGWPSRYVANNGSGSISVIDTATNAVTATIVTGFNPIGLDITADSARVYATINNFVGLGNVSVISTATNTVTGTIAVDKPTALGKFITPPPGPPPEPANLIPMSPPDFPYKVTFEQQCVESIGRLCLRKEIVRICVGGNCFKPPPPPPPPMCVRCALGAGLAAGAALGTIGAMVFARRRRP
jgi:YVTN family beta-propeller protein